MGLKVNHIIILENSEEFIILKEAMKDGKKYFLGMGLDNDRKVIPDTVVILEEYVSGFDTYVRKVLESELITNLTEMFKAQG